MELSRLAEEVVGEVNRADGDDLFIFDDDDDRRRSHRGDAALDAETVSFSSRRTRFVWTRLGVDARSTRLITTNSNRLYIRMKRKGPLLTNPFFLPSRFFFSRERVAAGGKKGVGFSRDALGMRFFFCSLFIIITPFV